MSCRPGLNSSARISMAIEPPMKNMIRLNTRYIVPMSLWFVAKIHRLMPVAGLMVIMIVVHLIVMVRGVARVNIGHSRIALLN